MRGQHRQVVGLGGGQRSAVVAVQELPAGVVAAVGREVAIARGFQLEIVAGVAVGVVVDVNIPRRARAALAPFLQRSLVVRGQNHRIVALRAGAAQLDGAAQRHLGDAVADGDANRRVRALQRLRGRGQRRRRAVAGRTAETGRQLPLVAQRLAAGVADPRFHAESAAGVDGGRQRHAAGQALLLKRVAIEQAFIAVQPDRLGQGGQGQAAQGLSGGRAGLQAPFVEKRGQVVTGDAAGFDDEALAFVLVAGGQLGKGHAAVALPQPAVEILAEGQVQLPEHRRAHEQVRLRVVRRLRLVQVLAHQVPFAAGFQPRTLAQGPLHIERGQVHRYLGLVVPSHRRHLVVMAQLMPGAPTVLLQQFGVGHRAGAADIGAQPVIAGRHIAAAAVRFGDELVLERRRRVRVRIAGGQAVLFLGQGDDAVPQRHGGAWVVHLLAQDRQRHGHDHAFAHQLRVRLGRQAAQHGAPVRLAVLPQDEARYFAAAALQRRHDLAAAGLAARREIDHAVVLRGDLIEAGA